MEHIYAVTSEKELAAYQAFAVQTDPRLRDYTEFLEREYSVCDLPNAIVWTSKAIATNLISNIPIPAYTNDFRVVITPDIEAWQAIYLSQLQALDDDNLCADIRRYYSHSLSQNHILQILGHELAHHSALFLDDFGDSSEGIWFEEGMVEYISRKYFLTEEEYNREYEVNLALAQKLNSKYGRHPLEEFGSCTYEGDYASIFYEYWRSFLTIHQIVEGYDGNVKEVFASYHRWAESGTRQTLLDWFGFGQPSEETSVSEKL